MSRPRLLRTDTLNAVVGDYFREPIDGDIPRDARMESRRRR